jgi:hypothetical protein
VGLHHRPKGRRTGPNSGSGDGSIPLTGFASWLSGTRDCLDGGGQTSVLEHRLADALQEPHRSLLWIGVSKTLGARELQHLGEPVLSGRLDQDLPVREMPVHRADADAGRACHIEHLHIITALREQSARHLQHAAAVAFRVGARLTTGA